ncbi:hypothetical protein QYE76_071666 [Lolium multiflorum]|uniref:Uncharacterized protein n=1 Tax=Lolium multiflorum TaxID=4521 RepID=A0AAD8SM09_LOLMU|nr:hypothetical protein QYE76_071666 [Lolium multiflorum]
MKTFDPWPVFFRREWGRNWPFLAGFAVTGILITKLTAGFTEEDLKNSKFVQEHKNLCVLQSEYQLLNLILTVAGTVAELPACVLKWG